MYKSVEVTPSEKINKISYIDSDGNVQHKDSLKDYVKLDIIDESNVESYKQKLLSAIKANAVQTYCSFVAGLEARKHLDVYFKEQYDYTKLDSEGSVDYAVYFKNDGGLMEVAKSSGSALLATNYVVFKIVKQGV